jgi:methylenetetrahydrofolate reductase (NADPH)
MSLAEARPVQTAADDTLRRLAARASVEATPRAILKDGPPPSLRRGTRVYIPHLPGAAFADRRAACAALAAAGMRPVAHVAAREVESAAALEREASALLDAGVDGILLIGGSGDRARVFPDVLTLLESGALQRAGVRRLGLAGHPDGHPEVDTARIEAALDAKLALAGTFADEVWIVTQFVFDAAPAIAWLKGLRARGVRAPVRIGLSGPASPRTVLSYALRCGVGPSLRVLRSRPDLAAYMTSRWRPDGIAGGLAGAQADRPDLGIEALHLFAFGGLPAAADWLADRAGRASVSEG